MNRLYSKLLSIIQKKITRINFIFITMHVAEFNNTRQFIKIYYKIQSLSGL